MGRARKQVAESFQHNAGINAVVSNLEYKWGNDGYAFWYKLQELLCRSDGHSYNCGTPGNTETLAFLSHLDVDTVKEILDALSDLGEIDRDLWKKKKIIWCQGLVNSLQRTYSKRANSLPTKPVINDIEPETADKKTVSKATKKKEPKKEKINKIAYGEFVHMTEEERQKLDEEFGKEETARAITILDDYKGSSGRKYASDYRAIRSWAMDRAKEEIGKKGEKADGRKTKFTPSTGFEARFMCDLVSDE